MDPEDWCKENELAEQAMKDRASLGGNWQAIAVWALTEALLAIAFELWQLRRELRSK